MKTPAAWLVHRKSDDDEVVLLADFSAAGRPSGTFTELTTLLRTDHNVWETAPAPYGQEAGLTGQGQVDRWVEDLAGCRVRGVVGYCAGTVYAAAIVAGLAAHGPAPALVLLDPQLPQRSMMLEDFERMISSRLAPVLSAQEIERALTGGRDAYASAADELVLAGALSVLCHEFMTPALRRSGLDEQRSVELPELFTAYLHWLAGSLQLDPHPQWTRATATLRSTDSLRLPGGDAAHVPAVTEIDVTHGELLRSTEVAATIDRLLG